MMILRILQLMFTRLQGENWIPQIVDDVKLPGIILLGGSRLKRWGLREECITRLLFESGGRVSEVIGLTLGDWYSRGLLREANAFSKGSNGRRVKFLRWNNETSKLLQRYFDTERRKHDPNGYRLEDYLKLNHKKKIDLLSVPLFLTNRGTVYTSKTYRENYWNPACRNAGIDADVHQARHWYVTMSMRTIYETSHTNADVQRRLRELIEYMKWKKGWEMIEVYQHYFDVQRHLEIQDKVHNLMEQSKKEALNRGKSANVSHGKTKNEQMLVDPQQLVLNDDFNFLMEIGGVK
ncbi:hypothetical protein [Brevibacillus centrosporus]|uniref:hypothetical protein n=1 Tax=Brevibacillus centrosporus TaxID=54910 RepID=UPI003B02A556